MNKTQREKGRDPTQSCAKIRYTNSKLKKRQSDNTKKQPKPRFHNDCGPTKDSQLE